MWLCKWVEQVKGCYEVSELCVAVRTGQEKRENKGAQGQRSFSSLNGSYDIVSSSGSPSPGSNKVDAVFLSWHMVMKQASIHQRSLLSEHHIIDNAYFLILVKC